MTKNVIEIRTTSTHRTEFLTDLVLLLTQVKEKKEKAYFSHFLQFLFGNRTFRFARYSSQHFTKPKDSFFANAHTSK